MKKFLDVIRGAEEPPVPVTCGRCPVSMVCVGSEGHDTGFHRFPCCGAVGYAEDIKDTVLLVIDCQQNTFYANKLTQKIKKCPMCSGEIVEAALRGFADDHYYVPTVHAKHGVSARVALWRRALHRLSEKDKT